MSPAKDGLLNAIAGLPPKRSHDLIDWAGGALQLLLETIEREAAMLADDLRALYDNLFIETASRRWLRPLFAAFVLIAFEIAYRRCKRQTTARSDG